MTQTTKHNEKITYEAVTIKKKKKQRKEEGQQKAKERLQQERERHLQEMARIEEHSETAKNQIEEDIRKLSEKIVEEEQDYQKKFQTK